MEQQYIYSNETYKIIGAAIEVHNVLGCGFKEAVYQEALEKEFQLRNIPYVREQEFPVYYKGELLNTNFRPDFVCYNKIIVELKAVSELNEEHYSQVLSYLRSCNSLLGLLINFGDVNLECKRIIRPDYWDAKKFQEEYPGQRFDD